jgi:hypothetical protein
MSVTAAAHPPRQLRKPSRHVATVSGVGLVTALVGGYGFGWRWTGFADNGELWDLLHLLLLPVALVLVPVWQRSRLRVPRPVGAALLRAGGAGFAVLVFGGYRLGWTWTGFAGNLLWDWLELLVLPVAVTVLPLWLQAHPDVRRRWRPTAFIAAVCFATAVAGGYGLHWTWTGFAGNTLWDWLQLMLVPFVLPVVVNLLSGSDQDDPDSVPGRS